MSRKVKRLQFAVGADLIGSKMSMAASPNVELTELAHGIEMFSKASNRTVVIPYSNIKAYELLPEAPVAPKTKVKTE